MRHTLLTAILLGAGLANTHAASMLPIDVTGWNADIVIGAGDTLDGRSATMDGNNDGATWYGVGYNTEAETTGLPTGLTTSITTSNLFFQLQPFGTDGNISHNAVYEGGILALTTPAAYKSIALIGSTGQATTNIIVTFNFSNGSAEVFTDLGSGVNNDWFNGGNVAYSANGRINVGNGNFDNVNNHNPRLYEQIFELTNTSDLVSVQIESPRGHNAIMAISGEAIPEVSSFALLSLSVIGLFARRRR